MSNLDSSDADSSNLASSSDTVPVVTRSEETPLPSRSGESGPEGGGHGPGSAGDPLPSLDQESDGSSPDPLVADIMSAPGEPEVGRDRREHGGLRARLDDEALAERTDQERVEAGLAAYDPDDVPPATDTGTAATTDVTTTDDYQEQLAEVRRQERSGELLVGEGHRDKFPPSSYDRS